MIMDTSCTDHCCEYCREEQLSPTRQQGEHRHIAAELSGLLTVCAALPVCAVLQVSVVLFGLQRVCVGARVTVLVCDWPESRAVNDKCSRCFPLMQQRLLSYLIIGFIQIANEC